MEREYRAIAWMISVMDSRAIYRPISFLDRQIIGESDCFVVSDYPSMLGLCDWSPASYLGHEAWLFQIYRTSGPKFVLTAPFRKFSFMSSPPHFRWLSSFGETSVYRPSVYKFPLFFRALRRLRVSFGDMDDLDSKFLRKTRPLLARCRLRNLEASVSGNI